MTKTAATTASPKAATAKKPAAPSKSAPPTEAAAGKPKVKPIPEGMHTVTPHLIVAGAAAAIDFYIKAFNAVEMFRLPGPDGKLMHAAIRIGDSTVFLVDEHEAYNSLGPASRKGTTVTLHLAVEDADGAAERAINAGAKVLFPVTEMFWGDRYGMVEDPYGHRWSVATHVKDLTADEIKAGMAKQADC